MKKLLLFICLANIMRAQNTIILSNGFDAVQYADSSYLYLRKKLGTPDKIIKDKVDQFFCSKTLGRDVHFLYSDFKVNLTGRKSLSYGQKIGRGKTYYNNCLLNECIISGKSKLFLNGKIKILGLDTNKLLKEFGKPKKIARNYLYYYDEEEFCQLTPDLKLSLKSYEEELICYSYQDAKTEAWFHFYFFPKGRLSYVAVNSMSP